MLETKYVKIEKLQEHPDNPRTIKSDDFDRLCRSIQDNPEFFEARPVLYNKKGYVFAGNQRLKAAKTLGLKEIPAILMDIDEEKEVELMMRDNIANGDWDVIQLANFNIDDLKEYGLDGDILGEVNNYLNGDDFLPDEIENQGKLDEGKMMICPHCGRDFEVKG